MPLPLTGITFTTVKNYIGAGENDLGQLCKHLNVSKWSKFKPVKYANVAPQRGVGSVWWKADSGNCGLNIPIYSTVAAMFTDLRNGVETWTYLKPSGGSYEPFRLADFGGYEKDAIPPFVALDLMPTYYASFSTMRTKLDVNNPSDYSIAFSDIGESYGFGNMYFGIAICKKNTTNYKYMTQDLTLSTGGGGVILVPISSELGVYDVVYFITNVLKTSFSDPEPELWEKKFIPIPDFSPLSSKAMQTVTIEASHLSTVYVNFSDYQPGTVVESSSSVYSEKMAVIIAGATTGTLTFTIKSECTPYLSGTRSFRMSRIVNGVETITFTDRVSAYYTRTDSFTINVGDTLEILLYYSSLSGSYSADLKAKITTCTASSGQPVTVNAPSYFVVHPNFI